MRDASLLESIRAKADCTEAATASALECDVAVERRCLPSSRANTFDGSAGRFEIAIESENARAVLGKRRCDRQPDARSGAGDDGVLSVESKHASMLLGREQ